MNPNLARWCAARLATLLVATAATAVVLLDTPVTAGPGTAMGDSEQLRLTAAHAHVVGHGSHRRRIVDYRVRSGDTITGIAVRMHAWTAELMRRNHLTYSSTLYVGEHLAVPVVPKRLRPGHHGSRHHVHHQGRHHHLHAGRPHVARAIARTAHRHRLDRELALAVAWQESGWRMEVVSSAGAIGAMQVLPATGRWMSLYVGRRLHLHHLHDNALAGVTLLRVLRAHTRTLSRAVAAYYQGLGAVHRYGLYRDTKRYVANVLAIKHRLESGRGPR
jgi:LysM repeat protein